MPLHRNLIIVKALKKHPYSTSRELATKLQKKGYQYLDRYIVARVLSNLAHKGIVRRHQKITCSVARVKALSWTTHLQEITHEKNWSGKNEKSIVYQESQRRTT